MLLTQLAIGQAFKRQKKRKELLRLGFLAELDDLTQIRLLARYYSSQHYTQKINARSLLVSKYAFNLNGYSNQSSLQNIRFLQHEIPKIAEIFNFSVNRTARSGYRTDSITSCCIVLSRLASFCRWVDIETLFGMHSSALSEIFWEAIESFIANVGHVLQFRPHFMQQRAVLYAAAITEKGTPLDNIVGFIDYTRIQMSRPGGSSALQRSCYSGHKRFHCLIYQTITTPDGLIFHLHGPEVGRRHDMTLYRDSGLDRHLSGCIVIDEKQFAVYGYPAYMLRPCLQVGFPLVGATPIEAAFNRDMSAMREAVEWSYKDLKQMWSSPDYKSLLRVRKAPIALMYKAAAILLNCKTCLKHSGQVGSYFLVSPPTLENYTSGGNQE